MYLAPQNIPRAIVVTTGSEVVLYCTVLYIHNGVSRAAYSEGFDAVVMCSQADHDMKCSHYLLSQHCQ